MSRIMKRKEKDQRKAEAVAKQAASRAKKDKKGKNAQG
jgi:hypothetical protein